MSERSGDSADIASQFRFFFPQLANRFPEAHISLAGFENEESSHDYEKGTHTEVNDAFEELHDQEADGREREACLHVGVHSPFP